MRAAVQTYARAVAETYAALGARVTVFTQTSAGPRDEQAGPVRLVDVGRGQEPAGAAAHVARGARRTPAPGSARPAACDHLAHFDPADVAGSALRHHLPWPRVHVRVAPGARIDVAGRVERRARGRGEPLHGAGTGAAGSRATAGAGGGMERRHRWHPRRREQQGGGVRPRILSLCRFEPRKNLQRGDRGGRGDASARACASTSRWPGAAKNMRGSVNWWRSLGLDGRHRAAGFRRSSSARCSCTARPTSSSTRISAGDGERDFEGFGIAIADAMYAGAAVIAGRGGGSRRAGRGWRLRLQRRWP